MERALVVNCGSSSVKYRLLEPASGRVLARGLVERIGEDGSHLVHRRTGDRTPGTNPADTGVAGTRAPRTEGSGARGPGTEASGARGPGTEAPGRLPGPFPDHAAAVEGMQAAFGTFGPSPDREPPDVVGHRIVHGGTAFLEPVLVDDAVLAGLDTLAPLAPLQNPAGVAAIRSARRLLPGVPQVAVFDTAFHASIPPRAATYAVPAAWRRDHGVRRYGFHGTSYAHVTQEAARILARPPEQLNLVLLHLGNGASACAVAGGRSVDTSMGLTPLPGLVMGTRSGDVDPALPAYLARVAGLAAEDVDHALNHDSGLLGLAGVADMRAVIAHARAGDPDAELALDVYCYRIRCYVGAYYAALGVVDAVVFTAGVGEHAAEVRSRSLAGMDRLGIAVDDARNTAPAGGSRLISPDDAPVPVLVVPTDEEREIAVQALAVARG